MQKDSKKLEERAYDLLGVKDLEDLQKKLDIANNSGLWTLTNKALNKMKLIQDIKNEYVPIDTVREEITKQFIDFLKEKGIEIVADISEDLVIEQFKDFEKAKGFKRGTIIQGARVKSRGAGLALTFNDSLKKRKNKLVKALDIKGKVDFSKGAYEERITVTFEQEQRDFRTLTSYPYYKLKRKSPEEAKRISEDEEIWHNFVQMVSSCVDGKMSPWVKSAMFSMGKRAFITTGESYGDIVGVLGEVQALAFLQMLGVKNTVSPEFLGHATSNKLKVGVDVALEGIGFQIKNYNTYGSSETKDEGIMMKSKYTLKNFLDVICAAPHVSSLRDKLEEFYAISAYHVVVHEDFNNIRKWIDHLQRDQLPNLYHSVISELLPIKQIDWVNEQTEQSGIATNAFYLIGGQRILPVSKILGLYIKFLENIKENVQSPKLITMSNNYGVKNGMKYTGKETYADYYNGEPNYFFSGYQNIADNISIHYNININIDYSLEEVLTKVLRA